METNQKYRYRTKASLIEELEKTKEALNQSLSRERTSDESIRKLKNEKEEAYSNFQRLEDERRGWNHAKDSIMFILVGESSNKSKVECLKDLFQIRKGEGHCFNRHYPV